MIISLERQGRFHQLIKSSKKKRKDKQADMNVDNKEKKQKIFIEKQDEEIVDLKQMLEEAKQKLEDHEKVTDLLKTLYENGFIDIDGNPTEKKV